MYAPVSAMLTHLRDAYTPPPPCGPHRNIAFGTTIQAMLAKPAGLCAISIISNGLMILFDFSPDDATKHWFVYIL